MRKVIAAINMTLDGFCDHTAGFFSDEELHHHYATLLNNAGVILYGRTTYQLMKFWQTLLQNPSEDKSLKDFAVSINNVEKLIFSNTIKETGWSTARIASKSLKEEVLKLKEQPGKNIYIGSRSLINQLLKSQLIDELQICLHPVIEGKGLPLFDEVRNRIFLQLAHTRSLKSGATIFYYKPINSSPEL